MNDNQLQLNMDADNSHLEELLNQRTALLMGEDKEAIASNVEEIFLEIMKNAKLVAAINVPEPLKRGTLSVGARVSFQMIASDNGEIYLPLFTKRAESDKWPNHNVKNTILMEFDNIAKIVDTNPNCSGIVVNPFRQNLVIPRKFVAEMKEQREAMLTGSKNSVLTADTPCELYSPSPYPMEMSNAIVETAKGTGAINSLWLRGVKLDGQDGYLLLVDFNGDRNVVFSRLGEAARPFLGSLPLHIVDARSGFGQNAIKNTVAFYNR